MPKTLSWKRKEIHDLLFTPLKHYGLLKFGLFIYLFIHLLIYLFWPGSLKGTTKQDLRNRAFFAYGCSSCRSPDYRQGCAGQWIHCPHFSQKTKVVASAGHQSQRIEAKLCTFSRLTSLRGSLCVAFILKKTFKCRLSLLWDFWEGCGWRKYHPSKRGERKKRIHLIQSD